MYRDVTWVAFAPGLPLWHNNVQQQTLAVKKAVVGLLAWVAKITICCHSNSSSAYQNWINSTLKRLTKILNAI